MFANLKLTTNNINCLKNFVYKNKNYLDEILNENPFIDNLFSEEK